MNSSTARTLTSKVEDPENEQNKNGATRVRPFRKLVKPLTGKRQLILQYRTKGNDMNNKKRIEPRLRIGKVKNQINS